MEANFATFEHEADIGIRGSGRTMEEAFQNAAFALYSVMVNVGKVRPQEKREISVEAADVELLFVEWLNALLSISDIERMVFSRFEVKQSDTKLTGAAWGEKLDIRRHEPGVEVKAATYHLLTVKNENGIWTAQCIVDV